jgi:mannose-6-phosphate isomerase-like protein (cupin superfamily)
VFGRVDYAAEATTRCQEHGGVGHGLFRRSFADHIFHSPIDFVGFTTIPAGGTIECHEHHGSEKLYYVARGRPTVILSGEKGRLEQGCFAIGHDGKHCELINDIYCGVEIVAIQMSSR